MPDYVPDAEHFRDVLEANGFRIVEVDVTRLDGRQGRFMVLPYDAKKLLKAAWSALDHHEPAETARCPVCGGAYMWGYRYCWFCQADDPAAVCRCAQSDGKEAGTMGP
jgi:hypothetical protein